MENFLNLPWVVSGTLYVLFWIAASLLGLKIADKWVNPNIRKKCHDVVGFTFGIVGVIYAVLLGFIVVSVNDRFNQIQKNFVSEAAVMLQLYRDAEVFPPEDRDRVRAQIKSYAELVYQEEWGLMARQEESENAYDHLLTLWREYYKIEPKTERELAWFQESLQKMNELAEARVIRLFNTTQSLSGLMWTMLVAGAVITIAFMYFFSVESGMAHVLLTALLAGVISFMLFLVLSLDTAFSGDVHVEPTEILKTMERFKTL